MQIMPRIVATGLDASIRPRSSKNLKRKYDTRAEIKNIARYNQVDEMLKTISGIGK